MDRLISAEKAIEILKTYVTEMESDIYYGSNLGIPEYNIEEAIAEVPTVDAKPITNAHWEEINSRLESQRCSKCGYVTVTRSNYCGGCGAKMNEGGD